MGYWGDPRPGMSEPTAYDQEGRNRTAEQGDRELADLEAALEEREQRRREDEEGNCQKCGCSLHDGKCPEGCPQEEE